MIYNEESKMHECALCDYTREWRGNLQFHVLAQHYQVPCVSNEWRLKFDVTRYFFIAVLLLTVVPC